MGHFGFAWQPMDAAAGALPLPTTMQATAATAGAAYCVDPAMYASVLPGLQVAAAPRVAATAPPTAEEKAVMDRHEKAALALVHLLVTCAGAIQAGDYAAAAGNLDDARAILSTMPTSTGIGRVGKHFAAALAQRLFPAFPQAAPPAPPAAEPGELYHHFYGSGPYLKFAHFAANQAILEAFEGCSHVHVVDFALAHGLQWPALIQALALRPGGAPYLRITGIGPPTTGSRDDLREVGLRLAELARSVDVPFSFRGVTADQLDGLRPWMFHLVPGEAVAVNSILQLHRLLVDPDAASTSLPAAIDVVLDWVASMQPKVFTVVEQEADHNKPALLERFTNALFHYGAMFDSMEAVAYICGGAGVDAALAEAYLQREIFDIVSGEGSGRAERHEPLPRWRERLQRAGFAQVPLGPHAFRQAALLLRMFAGAGYWAQESDGCLRIAWCNRPLYTASVWRATTTKASGSGAGAEEGGGGGASTSGHAVGRIVM